MTPPETSRRKFAAILTERLEHAGFTVQQPCPTPAPAKLSNSECARLIIEAALANAEDLGVTVCLLIPANVSYVINPDRLRYRHPDEN